MLRIPRNDRGGGHLGLISLISRIRRISLLGLGPLVLTACPAEDEPSSEGTTQASATSTTTSDAATSSEAGTSATSSSSAATSSSTDPAPVVPCTAIDFLFVVDNSSTMADEQVRLGAAAPDFVAAVRASLPEVASVHVGVVSTDNPALAVSASRCGPFAGGADFMTQDDDLALKLTCAAQLGVDGDPDERPIEVLLAAIDDLANQPGGLNSDFVRSSALLVLVIVSDEEDDHEITPPWGSEGDPPEWFTAITASKGGFAQDFVVVSLVGVPTPNACPSFQWDGKEGAELAPRLAELTAMFPFERVADVCAPSYDDALFDAVPAVTAACEGEPAPIQWTPSMSRK